MSSKPESGFYFRQHNDLIYKSVAAALDGDMSAFTQTFEYEEDFQIELINTLYCVTEKGFEINYNLALSVSKISGSRNKILGVRKGWPDLTCVWPSVIAFLELKAVKEKTRKAQDECHLWLRSCGFHVATVWSIQDALDFLIPLGLPVKPAYRCLSIK